MSTTSRSAPTRALTIRPARLTDLPALADLLVQLYGAELPDALTGAPSRQRSLLRFTLDAQPTRALQHRYVLCDAGDTVLATGMLHRPTEPPFERAPAGTIRMAMALLGYRATWRLLLTVGRSLLGVDHTQRTDTVLIHSVVVDERSRGQGLGHTLMDALEHIATTHGYQRAWLQVLSTNTAARRLYVHRGYQDVWEAPRWVAALSWSSAVMEKALT